jgi:type VI secretion system secreted protein VgrG
MAAVIIKQTERFLSLKTPLGPDKLVLTGFEGVEEMSRLFSFRLQMVSEDQNIEVKKVLGQEFSVAVGPPAQRRWFSGIVNRWEMGGGWGRDYRIYSAQIVPKFWLLTRRTNLRIFQQMSTPDILKQVLAPLSPTVNIQGTFEPRNYCVQYRETDFNFASRLMEEEGIFYFFKHSEGSHELVLGNTPTNHPDCVQNNVEYGSAQDSGGIVGHISGWMPQFNFRSGKLSRRDFTFELPDKTLDQSKNTVIDVAAMKEHELYDFFGYGDYTVLDGIGPGGGERPASLQKIFQEAPRITNVRMQEEEARYKEVDGQGNCLSFLPGHKFVLQKHPFTEQNGPYVLTSVRHSATDTSQLPTEAGPPSYANSFSCIPLAVPFRPASLTPKPVVQGPHTAFVVGPQGEEIFTDKYGRVKVQFPWDRQGQKDANSSCWVRVAQNWAGKQWGTIFIPRIGMEVIVDFIEGDPDRPIITGCVYNADFMPPYALPDNKTQSGIKTRSTLQGGTSDFNELRFEDKKGKEDIYFHAQKDFHRVVENDDDLKVGHDQKIEIKNHRTEELLEGNETVKITKGTRTHTVEGDESLTIKTGNRTLKVETGNDTHTVSKGNREVSVDKGNDTHKIKMGNRDVKIDMGNDTLTISMGNQTTKIDLGKQEVQAMQSIELKVGGSSLKVDQMGVTIKGMMVKLEGTLQLEAKGLMTTVKGDAMLQASGGIIMIG